MNRLRQILFKSIPISLCFIAIGTYGQKQSKTFKETFNVGADAIVEINISHADIEFVTWDRNEVVVEATIELDGATAEEAEEYFKNNPVKIMGNSKNIEISTNNGNSIFFTSNYNGMGDIDMPNIEHILLNIPELPELPEMPEMMELIEIAELSPMPPMPPMEFAAFDYKAYKKDGDAYLKKWKKEFDKGFDKDYQKDMEEWSKEMKMRREEIRAEREEVREVRREEMKSRREEIHERREEMQTQRAEQREAMREAQRVARNLFISRERNVNGDPNIFYFSSDGEKKNYKIKKTIKIKMPKSVKLKMNVRHGVVKLAENTRNINATLSYARLFGATVDGDNTIIKASYSPVNIQKWNHGQLKANYSENINLKEVKELKMSAMSSDVTIGRLLITAQIKNKMGSLIINNISNNFKSINISVEHGELQCTLPSAPYVIVVTESRSEVTAPSILTLDKTKSYNGTVHKGYHINKNSNKAIVINSKYSKVVLND